MWTASVFIFVPCEGVASNDQPLPKIIEGLRHTGPHCYASLDVTSNEKADAHEASISLYAGRTPRDAVRFVIKGGAKVPCPGGLLLNICALALHGCLLDQLNRDFPFHRSGLNGPPEVEIKISGQLDCVRVFQHLRRKRQDDDLRRWTVLGQRPNLMLKQINESENSLLFIREFQNIIDIPWL